MKSANFIPRDVGRFADIQKERVRFSIQETDLPASYCSKLISVRVFYFKVLFNEISLSLRNWVQKERIFFED